MTPDEHYDLLEKERLELQRLFDQDKDMHITLRFYECEKTITLENLIKMIRIVQLRS